MTSALTFTIGATTICIADGLTTTTFEDGSVLYAAHEDVNNLGQAETAQQFGYGSNVRALNLDHDPVHSLLATWLGYDASHTLHGAALGVPYAHADIEEDAVCAIQRWMQVHGITAVELLQRYCTKSMAIRKTSNE